MTTYNDLRWKWVAAGKTPKWRVVWIRQRSHWLRVHNTDKWERMQRHIGIDSTGKTIVLRDTPPAPRYHAMLPTDNVALCGIFPYDQTRMSRPGQRPAKPKFLSWASAPDGAEVTCPGCLKKIRAVMPPADGRPALKIKPAFRKPKPAAPKEPTGPKIQKNWLAYYTRPRQEDLYFGHDNFDIDPGETDA
jgi:hypothetical protein